MSFLHSIRLSYTYDTSRTSSSLSSSVCLSVTLHFYQRGDVATLSRHTYFTNGVEFRVVISLAYVRSDGRRHLRRCNDNDYDDDKRRRTSNDNTEEARFTLRRSQSDQRCLHVSIAYIPLRKTTKRQPVRLATAFHSDELTRYRHIKITCDSTSLIVVDRKPDLRYGRSYNGRSTRSRVLVDTTQNNASRSSLVQNFRRV